MLVDRYCRLAVLASIASIFLLITLKTHYDVIAHIPQRGCNKLKSVRSVILRLVKKSGRDGHFLNTILMGSAKRLKVGNLD